MTSNMSLFNGATRKQNVACDACRAKKIRCRRTSTTQRCEQCVNKDIECTSNYIEQLQSKPKKPRRFRSQEDKAGPSGTAEVRWSGDEGRPSSMGSRTSSGAVAGAEEGQSRERDPLAVNDAIALMSYMAPTSSASFGRTHLKHPAVIQTDLLRYLFSPTPVHHQEWRYSDVPSLEAVHSGSSDLWEETGGAVWDEPASSAHLGLWASGEAELENMTMEFLDCFFSIVACRVPILDADTFIARFKDPGGPAGPLPHALLAVVIALGAKFSDHESVTADRDESVSRDGDAGGGRPRSRMCQLLVIRAREVVETCKAFRVPTLVNAQSLVLLEILLGQSATLKQRYRASYMFTAASLMEQLGDVPLLQFTPVNDERMRTQLLLYMVSGFETSFYRLRPDTFFTINEVGPLLSTAASLGMDEDVSVSAVEEELSLRAPLIPQPWLFAARSAATTARRLIDLWTPRVAASGIPLTLLRDFVHEHTSWRDLYLNKLGIALPLPAHWSFEDAVKACSTDIFHHALWLVVDRAVRDFGIADGEDGGAMRSNMVALEVATMRERLKGESAHAASRIAMIAAVGTEQRHMRLDPLICYRPIFDSGMYLARQGNMDCMGCILALKQYAVAYPQMWDLALEIETALNRKTTGGPAPELALMEAEVMHQNGLTA